VRQKELVTDHTPVSDLDTKLAGLVSRYVELILQEAKRKTPVQEVSCVEVTLVRGTFGVIL